MAREPSIRRGPGNWSTDSWFSMGFDNQKREKKARLVAKGFQNETSPGESCLPDSPTSSKESLRMILVVSLAKNWSIYLDVQAAFLQNILNGQCI